MPISVEEVYETASMILHQNLDIRTTTLGINLKDCIESRFETFKENVDLNKILDKTDKIVKLMSEIRTWVHDLT